ncbi:mitochondrial proton/calcium exchanger protein-like protein isoform X1 [Tanacetum coccineum]|uniref:Mitochondrial proton/calcium exchanger protein-like protein isoform X1 n=1 Tax=Tanacetum coccineum TaxID=301880 RepID=A0ABQ5GZM3_9ASTR
MEDMLSKFMSESAKRHEENSNLIKEIRASTDAVIRNQGASIKTLEIQIGQMIKVLQERGFGTLPRSTEANSRDQVKSISTTIEADSYPIRLIGSLQYVVSTRQNRTLMYETRQTSIPFPSRLNGYYCEENNGSYGPQFSEAYSKASQSIPQKEKDPGSFTLPCFINNVCFDNALVELGASVNVMPLSTYLNLGLCELAHTKLTVELADRTVKYPKGIAKNIDVYKRKITLRVREEMIIFTSVKPTSSLIKRVYMLSLRERIELDLETKLMGETLVLNRSLDPFWEDYIELNDLNEPFKLRRNQGDDLMPTIMEGALMNVPIFVRTFSVVTDFAVLENMDKYRDEGIGNVIFAEPFFREVGINAKRFEGMIIIYNGNDEVSEKDKINGISHAYQKLKGFYKEVLNLGPDFIRVPSIEEWLTRRAHLRAIVRV